MVSIRHRSKTLALKLRQKGNLHLNTYYRIGLDLVNGKPRDNRQAGVYEPITVKTKSLKFATEAAITILRIDDLIKLFPEQKEGGQSYKDAVQSGSLEG